jgi:hypothetical protein
MEWNPASKKQRSGSKSRAVESGNNNNNISTSVATLTALAETVSAMEFEFSAASATPGAAVTPSTNTSTSTPTSTSTSTSIIRAQENKTPLAGSQLKTSTASSSTAGAPPAAAVAASGKKERARKQSSKKCDGNQSASRADTRVLEPQGTKLGTSSNLGDSVQTDTAQLGLLSQKQMSQLVNQLIQSSDVDAVTRNMIAADDEDDADGNTDNRVRTIRGGSGDWDGRVPSLAHAAAASASASASTNHSFNPSAKPCASSASSSSRQEIDLCEDVDGDSDSDEAVICVLDDEPDYNNEFTVPGKIATAAIGYSGGSGKPGTSPARVAQVAVAVNSSSASTSESKSKSSTVGQLLPDDMEILYPLYHNHSCQQQGAVPTKFLPTCPLGQQPNEDRDYLKLQAADMSPYEKEFLCAELASLHNHLKLPRNPHPPHDPCLRATIRRYGLVYSTVHRWFTNFTSKYFSATLLMMLVFKHTISYFVIWFVCTGSKPLRYASDRGRQELLDEEHCNLMVEELKTLQGLFVSPTETEFVAMVKKYAALTDKKRTGSLSSRFDDDESTVSESSLRHYASVCKVSFWQPYKTTLSRWKSCIDLRMVATWFVMCYGFSSMLEGWQKWNIDGTTFKCTPVGSGIRVAVVRESGIRGPVQTLKAQVGTDLFIKYMGMISPGGHSSRIVLILAIDELPKGKFHVERIDGLAVSGLATEYGYVVFCKSRAGNKLLWQWYLLDVVIPTISDIKEVKRRIAERMRAVNLDKDCDIVDESTASLQSLSLASSKKAPTMSASAKNSPKESVLHVPSTPRVAVAPATSASQADVILETVEDDDDEDDDEGVAMDRTEAAADDDNGGDDDMNDSGGDFEAAYSSFAGISASTRKPKSFIPFACPMSLDPSLRFMYGKQDVDPVHIFLTIDGELVILKELMSEEVQEKLRETVTILLKVGAGHTAVAQALDIGLIFRAIKAALKLLSKTMQRVDNKLVSDQLRIALQSLCNKFHIELSAGKRKQIIHSVLSVLHCMQNGGLTVDKMKQSFAMAGQHVERSPGDKISSTVDYEKIMRRCYGTITDEFLRTFAQQVLGLVYSVREMGNGQLTEEELEAAGVPPLPTELYDYRHVLCLNRRRGTVLTSPKIVQEWLEQETRRMLKQAGSALQVNAAVAVKYDKARQALAKLEAAEEKARQQKAEKERFRKLSKKEQEEEIEAKLAAEEESQKQKKANKDAKELEAKQKRAAIVEQGNVAKAYFISNPDAAELLARVQQATAKKPQKPPTPVVVAAPVLPAVAASTGTNGPPPAAAVSARSSASVKTSAKASLSSSKPKSKSNSVMPPLIGGQQESLKAKRPFADAIGEASATASALIRLPTEYVDNKSNNNLSAASGCSTSDSDGP